MNKWRASILLLAAIGSPSALAGAQTTLELPGWAPMTSCKVLSPDGVRLSESQQGRLLVPCGSPSVIACDGHGTEPLDIPVASACAARAIPLSPATDVRIVRDSAAQVTVEWLRLDADGTLASVAKRPVEIDARSTIPVTDAADRWIRFSVPDRAPLTVAAADLRPSEHWQLPDLKAGGELFLTFQRAVLPPKSYRLTGPFLTDIRRDMPIATLHGLPPGAYQVQPIYEGPVTGRATPVTVTAARTTVAAVRHEPVGAAVITASADICNRAEVFSVGVPRVTHSPYLQTREVAACHWAVGGLPPGAYEAALRHEERLIGRRDFVIVADRTTQLTIESPAVTVSGTVLVNKTPPDRATLMFVGRFPRPTADNNRLSAFRTVSAMAAVRANGAYEITLDEAGDYVVSLRYGTRKPPDRVVSFERGAHTFDLHIDDGSLETSLTVRVKGADPTAPIQVDIRDGDAGSSRATIPAGEDTITQRALGFGAYRVAARQPDATSDWERVNLSAARPSATIELVLTRATRSITLRDQDGEPVSHASFSNTPAAPEELLPGTYSLATVPVGTELVIRPPSGAPTCRIVHTQGDAEVVLTRGRSLTLQFDNTRITADDVRIARGGPSECAVPLQRFLKTSFVPGPGVSQRVEILNAPADDMLIIQALGEVHRVFVPGDGLVIVPSGR